MAFLLLVDVFDYVSRPVLYLIEHFAQINTGDTHCRSQDAKAEHHHRHYRREAQQGGVKKQLPQYQIECEGET